MLRLSLNGRLLAGLVAALALVVAAAPIQAEDDDELDLGEGHDVAPALVTTPDALAALASSAALLRTIFSGPREQWPPPQVGPGVRWVELGPAPPPFVDSTDTPARQALGRTLFFDPRLSRSGQVACASCHDPDLAWADGRTTSFGNDRLPLKRNAPSLLHAGNRLVHFWDGRASSLEDQAWQVISNRDEMHGSVEDAAAVVSSIPGYAPLFAAAYDDGAVTADRVVASIAAFERTLVGGRSAFDRFLRGEPLALGDDAVRGLDVFRGDGRCMSCHHGPLLTDDLFHDLGLSYYGRELEDLGRYRVTKDPADVGKFRTPTLRDVARTAPYTHLGLFDLRGLLNLYNVGMPTLRRKAHQQDDPLFPVKSPLLQRLDLSRQQLADLEAFLDALTEPRQRVRPPPLPR